MFSRWFTSKKDLLSESPEISKKYLLSCDSEINKGTKMFTFFPDHKKLVEYVDKRKNKNSHFHEIIFDDTNCPIFMFFDLDRSIGNNGKYFEIDDVISTFLKVLNNFLKDAYDIDLNLCIGKNVQVSTACYDIKQSAHIKIHLVVKNMALMKQIAIHFLAYILNHEYTSEDDRNVICFYDDKIQTYMDKGIYTKFRSFRLLYSSKWKTSQNPPLLPYGESSKKIIDHMVNAFDYPKNIPIIQDLPKKQFTDFIIPQKPSIKKDIYKSTPVDSFVYGTESCVYDNVLKYQEIIENSDTLKKLLKTNSLKTDGNKYNSTFEIYNYFIKGYYCPYAQRIHKSNRSIIQINSKKRVIYYKCFDEDCKCKYKSEVLTLTLDIPEDRTEAIQNILPILTLHSQDNFIHWNEVYDSPNMKPYPIKPICVVRANMGTGKTNCIIKNVLPRIFFNKKNASVLFITYQRLLSAKYTNELQKYKFKNYMDINQTFIDCDKLIICIDSLHRINKKYDYIFIDEATSVLLHFSSPLMQNTQLIYTILEILFIQANHIYFLDAVVDSTIVYDIIKHISTKKNVKPYFIKNTYIRPTNRRCTYMVNFYESLVLSYQQIAIGTVLTHVEKNESRVVLTSSTKEFVKYAEVVLKKCLRTLGLKKKILVYHSESVEKVNTENICELEEKWLDCDILIYSPTITAGVSFTPAHFDVLVSYIENNPYTPPADTILQQLFRVRQLNKGNMILFINDVSDKKNTPTSFEDIDNMLFTDLTTTKSYFENYMKHFIKPLKHDNSIISYDTNSLSYKILRGIISNTNLSKNLYHNIIIDTLEKDYKIPCNQVHENLSKEFVKSAKELKALAKKYFSDEDIPFSPNLYLSDEQLKNIEKKEFENQNLSNLEKTQKWYTHCVNDLWKTSPNYIDDFFYKNYISPKNHNIVFTAYYRLIREIHLYHRNVDDNLKSFAEKMRLIASKNENTNKMYKTIIKKHFRMIYEGQKFMDHVIGKNQPNYKELLMNDVEIIIDPLKIHETISDYIESLNIDAYKKLIDTYKSDNEKILEKDFYLGIDKSVKMRRILLAQKVLEWSFNITLKSKKNNKGNRDIIIKSPYKILTCKYNVCQQLIESFQSENENVNVDFRPLTADEFTEI